MSDQAEATDVWQGGENADLCDGRQWRVLRAWPADDWWVVTQHRTALDDGMERIDYEAEPLTAWAIVEVLTEDGDRYEIQTGIGDLGQAFSLKTTDGLDPHYLRGELPEDAERSDWDGLPLNGGAWSWTGLSLSERMRRADQRAARQAPAGAS